MADVGIPRSRADGRTARSCRRPIFQFPHHSPQVWRTPKPTPPSLAPKWAEVGRERTNFGLDSTKCGPFRQSLTHLLNTHTHIGRHLQNLL